MACDRTLNSVHRFRRINTLAQNSRHVIEPQGVTRRYLSPKELGAVVGSQWAVVGALEQAFLPNCRWPIAFIAFSSMTKYPSRPISHRRSVSGAHEAGTRAGSRVPKARQRNSFCRPYGTRSPFPFPSAEPPQPTQKRRGLGTRSRWAKLFRPTLWDSHIACAGVFASRPLPQLSRRTAARPPIPLPRGLKSAQDQIAPFDAGPSASLRASSKGQLFHRSPSLPPMARWLAPAPALPPRSTVPPMPALRPSYSVQHTVSCPCFP